MSHRKSYNDRLGKVLSRIADESQASPPPPSGFRIHLPLLPAKEAYVMELWQPGCRHPLRGNIPWLLSIPGPAERQTGVATGVEEESARILEWLTDRAAPPAAELPAAAHSKPEPAPPLCGRLHGAAPEISERWLDRSLAPACVSASPAGTATALAGWPAAELHRTLAPAGCAPVPEAEPAAAFLGVAATLFPASGVAADLLMPASLALACASAARHSPALDLCGFLPAPAAEPVAAFVLASSDLALAGFATGALHLPAVPALETEHAGAAGEAPELCGLLPAPAAEPVAAFVLASSDLVLAEYAPAALHLPSVPALETEHAGAAGEAPELCGLLPAPAAEAVAAFVAASSDLVLAEYAPAALRTPTAAALRIADCSALAKAPALPGPATVPAAEPVAAFVATQAALTLMEVAPAAGVLPALSIAAELEPLPAPEEPLVIPAACDALMPPPAAEPVWNFLNVAVAGALAANPAVARPVLAGDLIRTYLPQVDQPRRGPQAEPVMAGVWPRMAEVRVDSIETTPEFRMPGIAGAPARVHAPAAAAAEIPAAEPAERWLAATAALSLSASTADVRMPGIAALGALPAAGKLAGPVEGLSAEAVEDLAVAASAGPASSTAAVSLRPMELEAATPATVRAGQRPSIAASAAAPRPSAGKVVALGPVSTVRLALPEQQGREAAATGVPRPGLFSIEYHTQRTRSTAYARPEWKCANYRPQPPQFTLRAALDHPEDLIRPKQPVAGIFPINVKSNARKRSAMMEVILRVAAAVMIVTSIWFGAAALKNARRVNLRQEEAAAFATPNRVLTPEAQAAREKAKASGPLNFVRQAITARASVQVGDDFQHGLENWTGEGQAPPANWRRSVDGYMQTGALAMFRPTRNYVDYRLEFFGQIESKSVGWVVRARDDKNYHAMKFTVIERGLRPVIAMVHYNVVDGKAGHRMQIPLNVMVHNNQPFQVAVAVRGKHFVTSVDGEQVDDYREDAMPTGGVGFFSDAGEHARLYWARVTKNDDWLGHVCAFLSGGDARQTADLWPGSIPGGVPNPWAPAGDPTLLAAAWIGLPSIRRIPSSRRLKRCNR